VARRLEGRGERRTNFGRRYLACGIDGAFLLSPTPTHFLGIDGGATRCRARLRDVGGALLAEAEGAAANVYVDFDAAIAVIDGVIASALQKAGRAGGESAIALGLGLAGLSSDSDARRVEARFSRFAHVRAANDAMIACLGAHDGADGAIVISGTGSAAMARIKGRDTILGGRGFILGDDGSGARIGLDALRAAAKAADGLGPSSAMSDALLQRFGGVLAAVEWAHGAKPGDFGALAPVALDHAERGDLLALPIVGRAVAAIAALAQAARALGAERVALVGGLGEALRPFFDDSLDDALLRPAHDPVEGAIILAGGAHG